MSLPVESLVDEVVEVTTTPVATIDEPMVVMGEHVIPGPNGTLVQSKTDPTVWYTVFVGTCDCQGYLHRQTCRHLQAAAEAERIVRTARKCPGCGQVRRLQPGGRCASCILYGDRVGL